MSNTMHIVYDTRVTISICDAHEFPPEWINDIDHLKLPTIEEFDLARIPEQEIPYIQEIKIPFIQKKSDLYTNILYALPHGITFTRSHIMIVVWNYGNGIHNKTITMTPPYEHEIPLAGLMTFFKPTNTIQQIPEEGYYQLQIFRSAFKSFLNIIRHETTWQPECQKIHLIKNKISPQKIDWQALYARIQNIYKTTYQTSYLNIYKKNS